jgi:hypothetical protein
MDRRGAQDMGGGDAAAKPVWTRWQIKKDLCLRQELKPGRTNPQPGHYTEITGLQKIRAYMIQNCDMGLLRWVTIRSRLLWDVTPYSLVQTSTPYSYVYKQTAAAGSSQRLPLSTITTRNTPQDRNLHSVPSTWNLFFRYDEYKVPRLRMIGAIPPRTFNETHDKTIPTTLQQRKKN